MEANRMCGAPQRHEYRRRPTHKSIQAAKILEESGIDAEVIDVRTLSPLDNASIFRSVEKTGKLVLVEEGNITGGWSAEVAARVADTCIGYLDAPIRRVAASCELSSWQSLLSSCL